MQSAPSPTPDLPPLPLPKSWQKDFKQAVLHTLALARLLFAEALSQRPTRSKDSCCGCTCGGCQCARLESEIALVEAERDILYSRLVKIPPSCRPHYDPPVRLKILELIAARGWSLKQAAPRFLLTRQTLSKWLRILRKGGQAALLRALEPVNCYPDAVTHMVQSLKASFPEMSRQRIASLLTRAGIAISASTAGRMLERQAVPPPEEPDEETRSAGETSEKGADEASTGAAEVAREIRSRGPGHTWCLDITVVPSFAGLWLPWLPFSAPPSWPFCWHVVAVMDHYSRKILAFDVFSSAPTAEAIGMLLDRAVLAAGKPPRYTITDKGGQFWCEKGRDGHPFTRWCQRHGVRPRFGAVGKKGSICRIERFWKTFKGEWTRRIIVPFGIDAMYTDVGAYVRWYNEWRPHSSLGDATPTEVFYGNPAVHDLYRLEVRPRYPLPASRASPTTVEQASRVRLRVSRLDGYAHLPCVQIERAA